MAVGAAEAGARAIKAAVQVVRAAAKAAEDRAAVRAVAGLAAAPVAVAPAEVVVAAAPAAAPVAILKIRPNLQAAINFLSNSIGTLAHPRPRTACAPPLNSSS